ncbi:HNH endonuclease [Plantactinospora solaniradicis]|uniref:HNH endonuclease n=1 Tax=Plantactinospora solaniradicis TaxID=1723736 RepID=A0ABW1KQ21_9ACTN
MPSWSTRSTTGDLIPRAKKRCAKPGCKEVAPCKRHKVWKESSGTRQLPGNWSTLKKQARNFATKICVFCGLRDPGGQVDHVINRAEGGTDDPSNLGWACARCHDRKTEEEKLRGILRAQKKSPPPPKGRRAL